MNWKRILKGSAGRPAVGTYHQWKVTLAAEGFHQCVYCSIDETSFGGFRNFHVEHYRPKSQFALLENDFENLFYACSICNTFKGRDWPAEPSPLHDVCAYPSPSTYNYGDFIAVDRATGLISGNTVAMRYVIERLFLNRPQLQLDRRVQLALEAIDVFRVYFRTSLDSIEDVALFRQISKKLDDLIELHQQLRRALPYGAADVAR